MLTARIEDLTARIERSVDLESAWGIELRGLYAVAVEDEDYGEDGRLGPTGEFAITVNGQLAARAGAELSGSLDVVVTLHDATGRVLERRREHVDADDFRGLHAFSCTVFDIRDLPAAIRVHPQGC